MTDPRRFRLALAVGLAVVAACGNGTDQTMIDRTTATQTTATQTTATQTTATQTTAAQTTATQTSAVTDPPDATPSGIDLSAIVLRVTDLPEGWSEVPAGDDEGGSCLDGLFGSDGVFDPDSSANASFAASELGPFLAAWVVDRPTSEVLAEVDDLLVACNGATGPAGFMTTIDPRPVSGLPLDSLSVHGFEEDASGSRISFAVAGAGTDEATVFVFTATPLGEIDDELVTLAVNAMADRIPR